MYFDIHAMAPVRAEHSSGNRHRGMSGNCYSCGMSDSCDMIGMNCSSVPEELA
tara:strand:+ start:8059 stop:8217 length:159 start_codon:yes stop_codon:yes gene_type:complete